MSYIDKTMLTTKDHGFLTAESPAPGPMKMTRVGKGNARKDAKPMPLPNATALKEMAHAQCFDHVKVAGLRQKVCIPKGADRDRVIAEARELAGVE